MEVHLDFKTELRNEGVDLRDRRLSISAAFAVWKGNHVSGVYVQCIRSGVRIFRPAKHERATDTFVSSCLTGWDYMRLKL